MYVKPKDAPTSRRTYQVRLPVSLRARIEEVSTESGLSLNAFLARLLMDSVAKEPHLKEVVCPPQEAYCRPFSLRLPSEVMLAIQDGALRGKHIINDEIVMRVVVSMSGSPTLAVVDAAAWNRLSAAIDAAVRSNAPESLAELRLAKEQYQRGFEIK